MKFNIKQKIPLLSRWVNFKVYILFGRLILKVVDWLGFFRKPGLNTFRSVLMYGKKARISEKIS